MLSSPQLRPYQQEVIAEAYRLIRQGAKRLLVFAPTGSGKTVIASQIVAHAAGRGRRVLFAVHRDCLVSQTYQKFQQFGVSCGFIKAGWQENREAAVQIASVQTMLSRDWWQHFAAEVVFLDEAHLTGFTGVSGRMMAVTHPKAVYIGLTATPWRLSPQEGMGDVFEQLVCAPMPQDLIEAGFLVKPAYYGAQLADLSQVKTNADGEFDKTQLALASDQPEIVQRVVEEWRRRAQGRPTVAFAVNVRHSQHLCQAFLEAGIKAAHVDGTTPIKDRERIYQQLGAGEISVLSSCQALTEGFDVPAVSAILLCRGTQSKALHVQMVGRGLRLSPATSKRDCLVLDFAGNVERHGFIEDIKEIRLRRGREPESAPPPTKLCPWPDGGCGAILYAFQTKCPHCGFCWEAKRLTQLLGLEQLIRPEDVERVGFYRAKLREAFERHYAPSWAALRFQETYGHYPPFAWGQGAVFGDSPSDQQRGLYEGYLRAISARLNKDDSWIERYLNLEF